MSETKEFNQQGKLLIRVTIRVPEKIHEKCNELAVNNRRSLNNQIIFMLEKVIETSSEPDKI